MWQLLDRKRFELELKFLDVKNRRRHLTCTFLYSLPLLYSIEPVSHSGFAFTVFSAKVANIQVEIEPSRLRCANSSRNGLSTRLANANSTEQQQQQYHW